MPNLSSQGLMGRVHIKVENAKPALPWLVNTCKPSQPLLGADDIVCGLGLLIGYGSSPTHLQCPRISIDRSSRSTDPKPAIDRRSPKPKITPLNKPRILKGSELWI
ncbi:hypothetical protein NE237_020539 [Protea cynaroides]|uniref:Uncharacterized protein n=1 Tax=Protea cynaroides TaxID=273540 RepID=A0A9Q0H7F1_9MAGN|nr:hypothetical protein NE237_020539 [Protea cynaroides]